MQMRLVEYLQPFCKFFAVAFLFSSNFWSKKHMNIDFSIIAVNSAKDKTL